MDKARRQQIIDANNAGNKALAYGRLNKAARTYERAIRLLQATPEDDRLAVLLYENAGIAYMNQRRYRPAIRAFLRAQDGDPTAREQALRYTVVCFAMDGRYTTALSFLKQYEEAFAPHPDGWTQEILTQKAEQRRLKLAKSIVV